jgi:S-adenosylmethionine synthetase
MKSTDTFFSNFPEFDNCTVESVLEGHPDKVCDQICDAILDAYLKHDNSSKVAVECLGTGNHLFIGGEVFSNSFVDAARVAQNVYQEVGYDAILDVVNKLNIQSEQLRRAVLSGAAGDQGIMYGYACENNFNYLPYGVYIVNAIAKEIDLLRKKSHSYLPDGKVQVTIKNGHVVNLVICIQHSEFTKIEQLKNLVLNQAVAKILPVENIETILFNYNSTFYNGGFSNDTGLSGRKIIIDTYCGLVPHGGGSFSGKDPSKVDRSASYMARFVAKNIVANQIAKSCLVSVAYAFGHDRPVMINVATDKAEKDSQILDLVLANFDFRPRAIIERLDLTNVQYRKTATYGHFFDGQYNWEQIVSI